MVLAQRVFLQLREQLVGRPLPPFERARRTELGLLCQQGRQSRRLVARRYRPALVAEPLLEQPLTDEERHYRRHDEEDATEPLEELDEALAGREARLGL